jgi:hypothetical protein
MKIYPIPTTPIVDVFQGEGWEHWTRLLYKNGNLIPLIGEILTKEQLAEIQAKLQPK